MYFTPKRIRRNFEANRSRDLSALMDEKGMLNGQDREGLGSLAFGFSSVGRAGCESIAVYNALQCLGLARPLPEVIRDMERGGYMRLWGHMGAVPWFQPLLRRYGAFSRAVRPRKLQRMAEKGTLPEGSVFLFSLWNDRLRFYRGLHTFAGVWAPDGRPGWVIFNRFNEDRIRRRYATLSDVLKNGRETGAWLVIYRVMKQE